MTERPRVTVVGLGPAGPDHLTPAADAALRGAQVVFLRTARHPAAAVYLDLGAIALDHHYERASSFAEAYAGIVEELCRAAIEHGEIAYGVPGSPAVLESTVAALRADTRVEVELVAGMSFLDLCWERLGIDPVEESVRLIDGEAFATAAVLDAGPMLITQLWRKDLLSSVKLALGEDESTPVVVLHHLGLSDEVVRTMPLADLDRELEPDHLTSCYLARLRAPVGAELARLEAVVERLRKDCPWDREQTHRSLVRHLLEETYEVIEAIDEFESARSGEELDAAAHLEEELGDLLCQVLFHSLLAREEGLFDLGDVARTVHDKLVHRHPHVFGDAQLETASAVLSRWEQIKKEEKGRESVMDGIPSVLPALAYATKIERKARGVGLGARGPSAPDAAGLAAASARLLDATADEHAVGELLLSLARLAADGGIDPEDALRRAASRYRTAFIAAERAAAAAGTPLEQLEPAAADAFVAAALRGG